MKSGGEKNDCNEFNGDFVNCSYIQPILNQLPKKKRPCQPSGKYSFAAGKPAIPQLDWDTLTPSDSRNIWASLVATDPPNPLSDPPDLASDGPSETFHPPVDSLLQRFRISRRIY